LELDENANIISYEEYYPYGETSYRAGRNIAEVGLKRYRYTGKEKDEENGLYYYGARYYVCWLGRWTAADPAGLVDGLNLYMYCRGSPMGLVDKNGENSEVMYFYPIDIKADPIEGLEAGIDTVTIEFEPLDIKGKYETPTDLKSEVEKYKDIDLGGLFGQDTFNKEFIISNREYIKYIAEQYGIDPVAIAGVVAYERAMNSRGWISDIWQKSENANDESTFGIGYGSIHLNVAKAIENNDRIMEKGLLSKAATANARKDRLMDPVWAIEYIGAIMYNDASIYKEIAGIDIHYKPDILGTLFNTGNAEKKAETLRNKTNEWRSRYIPLEHRMGILGRISRPEVRKMPQPQPNKMGKWIAEHESQIRRILNQD
jgi:RHS repeat-associated protein